MQVHAGKSTTISKLYEEIDMKKHLKSHLRLHHLWEKSHAHELQKSKIFCMSKKNKKQKNK